MPKFQELRIYDLRRDIDKIDRQIATLMQQRVAIANHILVLKMSKNIEVVDKSREKKVLEQYTEILSGVATDKDIYDVVDAILHLSRMYSEACPKKVESTPR
jgi:chorismate mutase